MSSKHQSKFIFRKEMEKGVQVQILQHVYAPLPRDIARETNQESQNHMKQQFGSHYLSIALEDTPSPVKSIYVSE